MCCDIVCHLQGSFGPFGPKSEKSLEKGSRGLSALGAQKVRKQSKINYFSSFFQVFNLVFDFFLTFSAPRSQEAREPFSRLFSDFGPKGPNDPCKWSTISQCICVCVCSSLPSSSQLHCYHFCETPKGPSRTFYKNATTIVEIGELLRRSTFTTPPYLLLRRPFFGRKNVCNLADCVNSSPPLIFGKFQGFGGIWANSGKFGKFRENSGEFSGIQWGFVWRLI